MFKKKESSGLVKQINIRLNIDNYYDNEIWEKLSEELDNCYGSKNERLKMILYRGNVIYFSRFSIKIGNLLFSTPNKKI